MGTNATMREALTDRNSITTTDRSHLKMVMSPVREDYTFKPAKKTAAQLAAEEAEDMWDNLPV